MEQKLFTLTAAGIIHNPGMGRILLGKKENSFSALSTGWEFPSGIVSGQSLEDSLHDEIKKNTNLSVEVHHPVFSRTISEPEHTIAVYYYCETYQTNAQASGSLSEILWVKPKEYRNYIRIPAHPALAHLMSILEKKRLY